MARSQTYSEAAIAVIADGVPGSDFGNEFAYEVTFPTDLAEVLVGVDKASTSIYSDKTAELKVSYKVTSPTNDQFWTIYNNQQNNNARTFPVIIDTGVNTRLSFNRCSLKTVEGVKGGGKTTTPRVITLTCEEFKSDESA